LKEREGKGEATSEADDVQEDASRQAIAQREKHDAPPAYHEVIKA